MDTRTKIVTAAEALGLAADRPYTVVLATFDVLTAARIRRLQQIRAASTFLVAIVAEDTGALLPLRARAELAAALAIIDVVVMADQSPDLLMQQFSGAASLVDEREPDRQRTLELITHIRNKNGSGRV